MIAHRFLILSVFRFLLDRCQTDAQAYDLAKKKGYVVLRGTGYRRERKGSPLVNIFRQFCDANAIPCISVVTVRFNSQAMF